MLERMTSRISHRGPDEVGYHIRGSVGLGFSRLSIIDLQDGSQPMVSADNRFALVFNGEIYNYKEIREDLSQKGYAFQTNSDTEILLAMFEMGVAYPEKILRGMFAFALFDFKEEKLILSRDRLGKKPLYWASTANEIVFGSEIKSILASGLIETVPNFNAISDFMTLSYVPGKESAFKGIFNVQPGGRVVVGDDVTEEVWWTLPSKVEAEKDGAPDYEAQVLDLLKESVKYRLVSDVPMGIFLSGGVDSALVLALVDEAGAPPGFTAFTIGFDSASYDETLPASMVADYYDVDHVKIKMGPEEIKRIFSDVVYKADNLIANPAIFANYLLSEVARKRVKAVLNGGGGDELFFGYETYRADGLSQKIERIPYVIFKWLKYLIGLLPSSHKKLGFKYKAIKFLEGLKYSRLERHYYWRTIFTEDDKEKLFNGKVSHRDSYQSYQNAYSEFEGDDFYEKVGYADLKVWWGKMGLYQGDIMSMANSIELRMPFMDQELIALMSEIPLRTKFPKGKLKSLLKSICADYLPREILERPKSGFHVPLAEWYSGPLKDFIEEKLSIERVQKIPCLNYDYIRKVLDDHYRNVFDNSFKITNLIVFVEWYAQYFLVDDKE